MGPVSPQMTIIRIALAKVQALPSTIDECLAKIRKASLTMQRNSGDSSCCLPFSFCVSIDIIFWSASAARKQRLYVPRKSCAAAHPAPCHSLSLTTESETEQETDAERGQDRFRRVLADILLAVALKIADATARIIPYPFRAAHIFIGHCVRSRAQIFRRFAGVRRATLCFPSRLRRSRSALVHLVFVSHRFPASSSFV